MKKSIMQRYKIIFPKNHVYERASILFESLIAIIVSTILLTSVSGLLSSAMGTYGQLRTEIAANTRALNFQNYLGRLSSHIRQPWWELTAYRETDEGISFPWYIHKPTIDAEEVVINGLTIHNSARGLVFSVGADIIFTARDIALLKTSPLHSKKQGQTGLKFIIQIDNSVIRECVLTFSINSYIDE